MVRTIFWDVAPFCICMQSQYNDLYSLENDINRFAGSSNFSEVDSLDWFLIDKETSKLSFLLLSIPPYFHQDNLFDFNKLSEVTLSESIDKFMFKVEMQNDAYFLSKDNCLIVTSNLSLITYKVFISDDLYFLLSDDFLYQGFLLNNATNHILSSAKALDDNIFKAILERVFELCNQNAYDAMDDESENYLTTLNELEKDCLLYESVDDRLLEIVKFVKQAKFTFYDIEY